MASLLSDSAPSSLEAEIRALREENLALREVSHDAGLLARDAARYHQSQALLNMMHTAVERLRAALDRLADFGTARQDMAGARERVSLVATLEEVRLEVEPLLAATDGRVELEVVGNPHLWFSPKHLHSVLLNLVSNALKFRHPDRAPVVRVRAYRDATRLVVRVKDNGRGLSEAHQQGLFGMFKRFHPEVEGTGVGLYLVKKILTHAGGTVEVESQPGRGTTFILVFPA